MKKLLLTLGTAAAIVAPIATVVSCETTTVPNISTGHPDFGALIDIDGVTYYVNNNHIILAEDKGDTMGLGVVAQDNIGKAEIIVLDKTYGPLFEDNIGGDG